MSKIEISLDGRLSGEIVGIILGLGILIGVSLLNWTLWTLIIVPVSILIIIAAIVIYKRYKRACFDDVNLYYLTKDIEIAIPLVNIVKISPTYWPIDRNGEVYKITFRQKEDERSINIVPISMNNNFELFLNKLREVNPTAKIIETE